MTNGNGEAIPKVPPGPVPTSAQVGRVSFDNDQAAVLLTFQTPVGEFTFFLPFGAARVIANGIAQTIGGIVLPGQGDVP